jgi:putative effector of murein hydrolase LrgA (UPF0299 family)
MHWMKRIVGVSLLALALLLCPVWVGVVPESEPEIGAVSLILILYIAAIGLVLSVDSSDTGH